MNESIMIEPNCAFGLIIQREGGIFRIHFPDNKKKGGVHYRLFKLKHKDNNDGFNKIKFG